MSRSDHDSRTAPVSDAAPALSRPLLGATALAGLFFLAIPAGSLVRAASRPAISGEGLGLAGFMVVYGWFWLRVRPRAGARGGALALAALVTFATMLVLAHPDRWWPLPIYLTGVAGALSPARRAALGVAGVALLVAALAWIV